jgi:hypothetical protein
MQFNYFNELKIINKGNSIFSAFIVLCGRLRVIRSLLALGGNEATLYFINLGEISILALNL